MPSTRTSAATDAADHLQPERGTAHDAGSPAAAAAPAPAPAPTPALRALEAVVAAKAGAAPRAGQQQMVAAVEAALTGGRALLVEAPTGVGKSFGYLVPAVLHATSARCDQDGARAGDDHDRRRDDHGAGGEEAGPANGSASGSRAVVVATATKALQEQLVGKDLPFLAAALKETGATFSYAMLKGRSNYLCRARWEDKLGDVAVGADVLTTADGAIVLGPAAVADLRDWVADTAIGDRAEVDVPDAAWRELSVTSEECPGRRGCPFASECFVYAARDAAANADVVVVNTALYGAHLASGGHLLPEHDAVVFDEAHTLENVMAEALSLTVGPGRLRTLAYRLRHVLAGTDHPQTLLAVADEYQWLLERDQGRRVDPTRDELAQVLARAKAAVADAVTAVAPAAALDDSGAGAPTSRTGRAKAAKAAQAAQVASIGESLLDDLTSLVDGEAGTVAWVEAAPGAPAGPGSDPGAGSGLREGKAPTAGAPRLRRAPVDVGPLLAEQLFGQVTVVATSATLTVGGSFESLARRWGLLLPGPDGRRHDVGTLAVPSPFDFPRQGFLYVAGHLPDPRSDRFTPGMHDELVRLATAAGGRTLALFTSRTAMVAAAAHLRASTSLTVLMQGEASRSVLLETFTSGPGHVLCALASFWTGVDIPGAALSLVTIDKIPFPRREDPLMDARRQAADRSGGSGFAQVDLPAAATDLAQGAGRLIRSVDDRGVVALFDSRLTRKAYGQTLLASLPALYPSTNPDMVEAALARLVANL